jgi:hypothetical protein
MGKINKRPNIQAVFAKIVSVVRVPHFPRPVREVGIESADRVSVLGALLAAHGAQVDPQLLRFFIQVAALQAK